MSTDFLNTIAANHKEKERNYWLSKMGGELIKTIIPYDRICARQEDMRRDIIQFNLAEDICTRLISLSSGSDIRLHMILLAGVIVLLDKYTNNRDIIVGSPILRQEQDGDFINTVLAIRNHIEPKMSFKQVLLAVRKTMLEAAEHQNYPLNQLLFQLNLSSSPEAFPLFDMVILLHNIHDRRYIEHIPVNVVFSFLRNGSSLEGIVEYNASLYHKETITRLVGHLSQLLYEAVFHIESSVSSLDMLTAVEKMELMQSFNATARHYPEGEMIPFLFEDQVTRTPNSKAVIFEHEWISYRELDLRANQVANYLFKERDIHPEDRIGVLMDRTIDLIVIIIGIFKAGGTYIPLDPALPEERIRGMIEDSEIRTIISQKTYKATLDQLQRECDTLNTYLCIDNTDAYEREDQDISSDIKDNQAEDIGLGKKCKHDKQILESCSMEKRASMATSENTAYIIFTSGSTGKPKGVMITYGALPNLYHWYIESHSLSAGTRSLLMVPIGSDASLKNIIPPLLCGGSVVLFPGDGYDIPAIIQAISNNGVTLINCVPSAFFPLQLYTESSDYKPLASLQRIAFGGEALQLNIFRPWLNSKYCKCVITNVYGPTECTDVAVAYEVSASDRTAKDFVPIGKPIHNTKIYILNEDLQMLPIGVPGELCIGGKGVARGYVNRPELSSEKFIPNPFVTGETIYKTGDLAKWLLDGNIEFLGRIDQQVKIRGFRVELEEIATHLLKQRGVKEAIVLARKDQTGENSLCAYVVADSTIEASNLKNFLASVLPDYMVPTYIVLMDGMPLNRSGKIDRNALPEPQILSGEGYCSPRDLLDEDLAEIWSDVLKVEKIGIDDNFFDLGGHSLKAIIIITKIHKKAHVKVPIAELFKLPTIRDLADYIKVNRKEHCLRIAPVEPGNMYPVSSAQKRLFYIHQMQEASCIYNTPVMLLLEGYIDRTKLELIFQQLIERHESFRTSFEVIDGEFMQQIHTDCLFSIDYYVTDEKNATNLLQQLIRPFDLTEAPLLRVGLIQIGDNRHIMIVDMHHIISDGTSMGILVDDFITLYKGEVMPPLQIQYKDYACWQNTQKETDILKKQEIFWREEFADGVPKLELPADFERPTLRSFAGDHVCFSIGMEETAKLKSLASDEGATLSMVLLALFTVLLSKLTGQDEVIVGLPVAGRRHADLERIIGMFVNTLAVRNKPTGEKTFSAYLREVRDQILRVLDNQDFQFDDLVQALDIPMDVSRNPIFDVAFALQNIDIQDIELSGLRILPYDYDCKMSKFDLSFITQETDGGIICFYEYCTDLFEKETIELFRDNFLVLIKSVLDNPLHRIDALDHLTDLEKECADIMELEFSLT